MIADLPTQEGSPLPRASRPPARDGAAKKLPALTGLRFAAAAMIVLHHSRGSFGLPADFLGGVSLQCGVSFFFVLSGFILCHVYPRLEDNRARTRFMVARFARIWPAHFFSFLLVLALGLPGFSAAPTGWITAAHLGLLHAWVPATAWFFSFNAVSWSISTEFFFYAAFPWLILGFSRNGAWKLLLSLLVTGALVETCVRAGVPTFAAAQPFEINRAGLLYISPLVRIAEFILGMMTARLWKRFEGFVRLKTAPATVLECASLALCFKAIVAFSDKSALSAHFGPAWAAYLSHSGPAPLFALLIGVFACQAGWLACFFSTRLLVLLGEISFSIYLLHQIFLRWMLEHRALLEGLSAPLLYALFVGVLLGASYGVWRGIEHPGRRLLLKLAP